MAITYNKNRTYLLAAGSVAVFTLLFSCGTKEKPKNAPESIGVTTLHLNKFAEGAVDRIQYNGTVQADKVIDLSFQVSGTITTIPVQTGQYVNRGQLVAAVDETVYRDQYNAQLAQAKLADENYRRTLEVFNKGSVAEIKMLEARSNYEQAAAAAKATYQNIVHTKLFAPQDGYIGDKKAEAGATAGPGTPIIQLLDIHSVKVLVAVPEAEINEYKAGDEATITIDALGGKPMTGHISEIGVLSAAGNASYNVKVSLGNPAKQLKPGMLCKAVFKNTGRLVKSDTALLQQVVVPAQTVQVDEQGTRYVYIVDEQGKNALRKNVETGALYNSGIAIIKGLSGNERLITSGYQKLGDHTPVTIIK